MHGKRSELHTYRNTATIGKSNNLVKGITCIGPGELMGWLAG